MRNAIEESWHEHLRNGHVATQPPRPERSLLAVEIIGGTVAVKLPRERTPYLKLTPDEAIALAEEMLAKARALKGV